MEYNDIDIKKWKEYPEIITDSLWIFKERDKNGAHVPEYHGNFIPQIPNQLMLRFTKKGEWVLDPFMGLGTTLIEGRRLGRNCVGIEINNDVAEKAEKLISSEKNKYKIESKVITGDSANKNTYKKIKKVQENYQLIILHPPYWDIIKFGNDSKNLSNLKTLDDFLKSFEKVIKHTYELLDDGRFLAVIIGDKYKNGEWFPLGFHVMNEILKHKYKLKSIIVKDIQENRGKRGQYSLWRYRALKGGYYIFKHEYIMLFQKTA